MFFFPDLLLVFRIIDYNQQYYEYSNLQSKEILQSNSAFKNQCIQQ